MIIDLKDKITIPDAVKILGVTRQRVHQMWRENKIRGIKIGRDIFLDKEDVMKLANKKQEAQDER
jgi:excisionase family DNA binding protein